MDKALTPEYLDWHAKLIDSPSHLTDKIRSSLYRAYTEETELDPWIKSEAPKSSQISKISITNPNKIYQLEAGSHQYAIKHKIDPKKFSVITETEKKDRERLVGEELLCRSILKSGLSIAWLDNLMEEWEKIHTQF
ncbi:9768_t:CDS:2, partial [Ambispora gerdemannii]